jgi:hypothetical protein
MTAILIGAPRAPLHGRGRACAIPVEPWPQAMNWVIN